MPEGNGDDAARSPWTADFVKGKGNARIFLLHGPPGVGKSYTAGKVSRKRNKLMLTYRRVHGRVHATTSDDLDL